MQTQTIKAELTINGKKVVSSEHLNRQKKYKYLPLLGGIK